MGYSSSPMPVKVRISKTRMNFSACGPHRTGQASIRWRPQRPRHDIQGVEDGNPEMRDGAGWTISIMDPEGTMVMAVAGDGFAVVGLGACVPKP